MKRRRTDNRSGESIVEVMVSAVIFLLPIAILQGAVMFANSAQKKSGEIRQNTAAICKAFHTAGTTVEGNGDVTYEFYATSPNGKVTGNQVFSIKAYKQKKTVPYKDTDGATKSVTFYLYGGGGS